MSGNVVLRSIPSIHTREQLIKLATELGVRPDWHEPDEQGVSAKVVGKSFDNAFVGYWEVEGKPLEQYVLLRKDGKPLAFVNLAMLFAWATGYKD